ncbi:MAG TPA: hypothetical protein VME43_08210 [Bryobacteraceae bacterium]|nr:hypothetical protein [Bryobacteraceae bacterium]
MSNNTVKMFLVVLLTALVLSPVVKADQWDLKTVFTFSGPVAIPGQVLPAGTYVFKLASSASNRHIVQVFNKEENHVYGTFLAIPDYRQHPTSKPLVKFHESASGDPPAIKAWFYPGRTYGHELVYPKKKAVELASLNNTTVAAMPSELAVDTVKPDVNMDAPEVMAIIMAPVTAEKPSGEEVTAEAAFSANAMPEDDSDELPATASALPLIGIAGMLSLAVAAALRLRASAVQAK